MLRIPVTQSTQRSVVLRTSQAIAGGTLIHLEDTNGNSILTFKPVRNYSAVLVSSPVLAAGASYRVHTGGSCAGTLTDGLYMGGTYSPGTLKATFTSTSVAQSVTS